MAKQSFKYYTPRDKPKKRGPRQHKKSLNKSEKRQKNLNRYKGQGWQSYNILYIERMKGNNMKTVTINVTGASQNQWSTFLLELNLMKKAWRSYGVSAELKAKSLNKIITQGTSIGEKKVKRKKNHITKIFGWNCCYVEQNQRS